jgi:hypothetical protein
MRKLIGLLALALVAPVWSQLAPAPSPTSQASQPANKEPEALTRAKAYIENTSEAQSIEKTKQSVLKIRNCLQFQTTLDAIKSEASYKQFEWPGFYEFRNPSDKAIHRDNQRINQRKSPKFPPSRIYGLI